MQSKYSFSCGDAALTVNVYGIPRVAVQLAACKKPTLKQVYSVGVCHRRPKSLLTSPGEWVVFTTLGF